MTPADSEARHFSETERDPNRLHSQTGKPLSPVDECARAETQRVIQLSREMLNELTKLKLEFAARFDSLLVAAESCVARDVEMRGKTGQQKPSRQPSPPSLGSQHTTGQNTTRDKEFKKLTQEYATLLELSQVERVSVLPPNPGRICSEITCSPEEDRLA